MDNAREDSVDAEEMRQSSATAVKQRKRIPPHLKYPHYLARSEESLLHEKLTTSMVLESMSKQALGCSGGNAVNSGNSNKRRSNQSKQNLRRPVPKIVKVFDLADNSLALVSNVSVDEPLFQPYPLHVQFDEYQPFKVYKKKLQFRNNDCVPRKIRVLQPSSQHFSVAALEKKMDKIAAGMEATFVVTFRPHEKKDYHEKIICETERERFIVEVSALGPWTCVNFPDEVGFGLCPVNHRSAKTFLVRNVGEEKAQFSLNATPPFTVEPPAATLDVNTAMQVTLYFSPKECVEYEGELEIAYANSQRVYTFLHGTAENVCVRLEEPVVELDSTYITLISTKTVRILNTSDIPVHFKWVSFRDEDQDNAEKKRLGDELDALEEDERKALEEKEYDLGSVPQTENHDEARHLLYHADLEAIRKHFNHLRTTLNEDSLIFSDENFSIEPKEGSIWAQSSIEVTLTFKPLIAADFKSTAFLSVNGRDSRLPLQLFGRGLGPKAAFASTLIDTGEVYVGSIHRYQLELENKGEIACKYKLEPLRETCANKIGIEPSEGELDVEDVQELVITYCSKDLGEVSEVFQFAMQGSSEVLKIKFQGSVIGPTFNLDVEEFCLGRVGFDFPTTHPFNICNTSDIPMIYKLRIPGDGKFNECEFAITPQDGTIPPQSCRDFVLQYLPKTRRRHEDLFLVVDVDGVGEAVHKVRIWAESIVPNVSITPSTSIEAVTEDEEAEEESSSGVLRLPFGECYLRYPYTQLLLLQNQSDVTARYEVLEQDEASIAIAQHTPTPRTGEIEPKGQTLLEVSLSCQTKGDLAVPLYIHIAGKETPPVQVELVAHCVGPFLELSATSIEFGKVGCLENTTQTLSLKNPSLIKAPFQAFVKGSKSRFALDCYEGCLEPGEDLDLAVFVNANDTGRHKDTLYVSVKEGETYVIPLFAVGVGSTIRCHKIDELKDYSFGDVFTSRKVPKHFVVENKGKRAQLLSWRNLTAEEATQERNRLLKQVEQMLKHKDAAVRKKARRLNVPDPCSPGFTVHPDSVLLQPKTACRFTVTACCSKPGQLRERFTLSSKVGKEKRTHEVTEAEFSASFIVPLLEASSKVVAFEGTYDGDRDVNAAFEVMTQPLKLKNISTLPINFTLRTQVPFSVDTWEVALLPKQEMELSVKFDPNLKEGLESYTIEGKLAAVYQHHPQRDNFQLKATMNFPNLRLESNKLDFGVVLNDTSSTQTVALSNDSRVAATYQWVFADGYGYPYANSRSEINDVFDISPSNGHLAPGESQEVEISFTGHAATALNALAVCQVEGGPGYKLELLGACSDVSFEISEETVNVGNALLGTTVEDVITITNSGNVRFGLSTSVVSASLPGLVSCTVSPKEIKAGQSAKLRISVHPTVPMGIDEVVYVSVAHFPKVPIRVRGAGVVASAFMSLPRRSVGALEAAKNKVLRRDRHLQEKLDAAATRLETQPVDVTETKKLRKMYEGLQATLYSEADRSMLRQVLEANNALPVYDIHLPEYIIDFGHVVHGNTRKQRFRLINNGRVPLTLSINPSIKLGEVLSIEPTKVDNLAVGGTVDFKVQLASKKLPPHHAFEAMVQLDVQHGPPVLVAIQANVTIPAVQVSSRVLDFGDMMLGECRECCVQLKNVSEVSAEWSLLGNSDKQGGDVASFEARPSEGRLQPGEVCNVSLIFTPREGRVHQAKVAVEVKQNLHALLISCQANVLEHKVVIEEDVVELGPVLPGSKGAMKTFTLVNESPRAAEVFCVELDEQVEKEEGIIAALEQHIFPHDKGLARLPPRTPGEGLPPQIMQRFAEIVKPVEEDKEEEEGVGEVEFTGHTHDNSDLRLAPLELAPTCRERGLAVDILVLGPPFSGQSTVSNKVSVAMGDIPVRTLDEMLRSGAEAGYIPGEICVSLGLEAGDKASQSLRLNAELNKGEDTEREGEVSVGLLARVVRNYLFREECKRGVLLDGLKSAVLDKAGVSLQDRLKSLLLAFTAPFSYPTIANSAVYIIPITASESRLEEWLAEFKPEKGSDQERRLKEINTNKLGAAFFAVHSELKQLIEASISPSMILPVPLALADEDEGQAVIAHIAQPGTPREVQGAGLGVHPMVTYAVLRRPTKRAVRTVLKEFRLVSVDGSDEVTESRWILGPGEKKTFTVCFAPGETGELEQQLTFEVVGHGQQCWTIIRGLCAVPTISMDPRNVFMNRVKARVEGRPVWKRFVLADGEFEYGPLLAQNSDTADPLHSEVLRISNTGHMPIRHISFSFNHVKDDEPGDEEAFTVEPQQLEIGLGETKEIIVRALPMASKRFRAQLLCSIEDNPEPKVFVVTCEGMKPELSIQDLDEATGGGHRIDFDRLLLGREESQSFRIVNDCALDIDWSMDTAEVDQCEHLTVSNTQGRLSFKQSVEVVVTFSANESGSFAANLPIIYRYASQTVTEGRDEEQVTHVEASLPIEIAAEGYGISVKAVFNEGDENSVQVLDFGAVRVMDKLDRTFKLENQGKYKTSFQFKLKKKRLEDVCIVDPMEGSLEPGESMNVTVALGATKEIQFQHNKDLICRIMEDKDESKVFDTFTVPVSVVSSFSRYKLSPPNGIAFGAVLYETQSEQLFEIHNQGEFEFSFAVLRDPVSSFNAKEHALPNEAPPSGVLRVGQDEVFAIEPQGGRILPNSSTSIKVNFTAKGHSHYRTVLHILLSGLDPAEASSELYTIPYELVAESCIPGINTVNYESIFEEQAVVRSLAGQTDPQGLFATEERCFSFGSILPSTTSPAKGACERFKLSNPNNVKAKVQLRVDQPSSQRTAFQVHPASIELPPHEFEFVSVYFLPSAMQTYAATFIAEVDNGSDERTKRLEFELRGEGTLPCVTVIEPATFTEEAKLLVNFGRLRTGRSATRQVVLRNDGTVPSTVRFDSTTHEAFQLPCRSSSCTLQPEESRAFDMEFCPTSSGHHSTELLMRVLHNEYELTRLLLKGEAFMEDVSLEDDNIDFGHLLLNDQLPPSKTIEVVATNHSINSVRFQWPHHETVSFEPMDGVIEVGKSVKIEATITCDAPLEVTNESFEMSYERVEQEAGEEQEESSKASKQVLSARLSVVADYPTVETSLDLSRPLVFKPTMMLQSRVFKFYLRNTSQVDVGYNWRMNPLRDAVHGCPFAITPNAGSLAAQTEETFILRFSPKEVDQYLFVADAGLPRLQEEDRVKIEVHGQAKRPICHFDLPPSNYLESRSSGAAALDGSIRVVEMESLGVRVKNSKRFYVTNPMSIAYSFKLEPVGDVNGRFNCLSKEGVIPAGKRYEVVLTFIPDDVEFQESLWQFIIPDHGIKQMLLLVGRVIEPRVSLERRHINYHTVLVGGRHSETLALINEEHIPFSFSFDASTGTSDYNTGKPVLSVTPRSGTVPPNGKLMLCVQLSPAEEKAYNFNLVCRIHNKAGHLSLNVKGEGSAVHEELCLRSEDLGDGRKEVQLSSKNRNQVDFGYVHVNDQVQREVVIRNQGTFNFDYRWDVPEVFQSSSSLSLSPLKGVVRCGEEARCSFSFHPRVEMALGSSPFSCTIAGDKVYQVVLSGQACKPSVSFSFMDLDFGPWFVGESGLSFPPETSRLVIANNEPSSQVSIDCLFEKKGVFEVHCSSIVLQPGESKEVPINFLPTAFSHFEEVIPFEINGLYTVNVQVRGEGVPLKLQLEDPEEQHLVCFGPLKLNEEQTKMIGIVNCSKRALDFEIREAKAGAFAEQFLEVHPMGKVSLSPKERLSVSVKYAPRVRRPAFSEDLLVGINSWCMPLASITGACHAVDVKLDTDRLMFGSVCSMCTVSKRVVLRNIGDLSTRFQFVGLSNLTTNFTLFPTQGVIQPQNQVNIEVMFHPREPAEHIRKVVQCRIEGMEDDCQSLTLAGACIEQPEEGIKTVDFQTHVRQTCTQTVEAKNESNEPWRISPVVENEYWTAPNAIEIAPQSTAKIDIAYCPLTMTQSEENCHQGTMFIALPNGVSMLFQLRGKANPPQEMPEIVKTAVAKKLRHLEIPIENWLNETQRFNVRIERRSGTDTDYYDGSSTIDLPPLKSRKYKLRFTGYRVGESAVKVTFTNASTQEYLCYTVRVKCEETDIQETISLEAPVRQSIIKSLTIANPFDKDEQVEFVKSQEDTSWWTCDSPHVRVREVTNMSGREQGVFEIDYRPLHVAQQPEDAMLVIKSERLGEYKYALRLASTQPPAESSLHFRSTLGSSSVQKFRFTHFLRDKAEISCKVTQPLFFKVVDVVKLDPAGSWAGSEASVTVEYEPQALGDVKDTLLLESASGGQYECSLYGNCEPPRPQGPIKITTKGTPLHFKNVFNEPKEYRFTTDSRAFNVEGSRSYSATIDASKAATVTLKHVPGDKEGEDAMGKLLVTCTDMPTLPAWTYYMSSET